MGILGECLFASLGLESFLTPGPILVTAAARERAAQLPRHVQEAVRRVMRGQRAAPPEAPMASWETMRNLLTEPVDPRDLTQRLGSMQPVSAGIEAADTAAVVVRYLRGLLPQRETQMLLDVQPAEPTVFELDRLRCAWAIAETPLAALRDFEAWQLSRDEATAFAVMYPQLYEYATVELVLASGELRGKDVDFELEKQIKAFIAASPRDAELARQLQGGITQDQAKQEAQKRPRPSGGNLNGGQRAQTTVQRVEAK